MKTKIALISGLIIILAIACKKIIGFYVSDSTTTTIPAQTPINLPFNIIIPPVQSSNTKEFENNKTAPDLIKTVELRQLKLTILSPSDATFSFLKSISIYIMKSDGSSKKKIAYNDNVNSASKTLELQPTGENLVPYLRESTYKLETEYTVKEIPTHDIKIQIDLKFYVTAGVL